MFGAIVRVDGGAVRVTYLPHFRGMPISRRSGHAPTSQSDRTVRLSQPQQSSQRVPRTPPPLRRGYPANAIDLQWCPHRFASVNQLDSQPTGSNLPTKAQRIVAILQLSRFQAYRLRRKQNWWTALLIQVHDLDPNRTVSQSIVAQGQSHRTGGAQR